MGTEFCHFSSYDWPERFLREFAVQISCKTWVSKQMKTHAKFFFLTETSNNKIDTSKNCSIIHACNKSEKIQINPKNNPKKERKKSNWN